VRLGVTACFGPSSYLLRHPNGTIVFWWRQCAGIRKIRGCGLALIGSSNSRWSAFAYKQVILSCASLWRFFFLCELSGSSGVYKHLLISNSTDYH
jgi:hypothetical protein